jgi:hypothetical protein
MYRRFLVFLFLLAAFSLKAFPQAWSGILAPSRAITWEGNVGIPGGIPSGSYTQCGSTIASGASTATIQSALNSCTANHYVLLGAGSFTLTASVHNATNNVVLRGAGPTQTTVVLNGNNILMGNGTGGQGSVPSGLVATSLSTLTRGSTVLTVASTTGMSVGQVVQIDQLNDTNYVNIVGNEGAENAGLCSSPLGFSGCSTRAQLELVQITAINAGANTITIAAPGLSHDYTSGLTPQVSFWSTSGSSSLDGVENMTVDAGDGSAGHAASDFAVSFPFCNECWVKNVSVIHGHRAAIYFLWSYRDEVRDSYISESNTAGAPTEYGIECDTCSLYKIENNILFGVTSPILIESSYGGVVGYNYMLNTSAGNEFPNADTHRVHNFLELYEGNVLGTQAWDFIWGGGSQNTMFRSRPSGNDPNKNNYQLPLADSAWNRYMNVVGNVLGDPTFHKTYTCDASNLQPHNDFIYELGFNNRCELGTGGYDSVVGSSLMRWENWDAATYCTNGGHGGTACGATGSNGIRACTASGVGNPACTADERGNSSGIFTVLSGPSTTLPASFYLSAKPSWWGSTPYPAIGPDVTTGTIANTAGHAAKIPAQLCYENTAKSGGFLTAFDAAACYAAGPSTGNPPSAPTGLVGTVN